MQNLGTFILLVSTRLLSSRAAAEVDAGARNHRTTAHGVVEEAGHVTLAQMGIDNAVAVTCSTRDEQFSGLRG